jgi:thiamine-phosphate pyrophosphorylase
VPFLRIIDVNLNRLDESLKLIEDITRFHLENKILLSQIRNIRRDFLIIKRSLPLPLIISTRRSHRDLGRKTKFDLGRKKDNLGLLLSSFSRAKESSRTIEETLKTTDTRLSNKAKQIRFQIYDLEKKIIIHYKKAFNPYLHAIIDEQYIGSLDLQKTVRTLVDNGATMIQLRTEKMNDRDFLRTARQIRKTIIKPNIKFIINNRVDIALSCAADGVHLGQKDISVDVARKIAGEMFIIGASAHNVAEAKRAEKLGADYLGVGAIFQTETKREARICGMGTLRSIIQHVTIPVIAIGGINDQNYHTVLRTGAAGIAVASFLYKGNTRRRIRSLTRSKK